MGDERDVVKLVKRGQLIHPTNILHSLLVATNHNPDAGQPMRDEDEADHQKTEDDCAVLRESLHLLQEPRQPHQPRQLQQLNRVKVFLQNYFIRFVFEIMGFALIFCSNIYLLKCNSCSETKTVSFSFMLKLSKNYLSQKWKIFHFPSAYRAKIKSVLYLRSYASRQSVIMKVELLYKVIKSCNFRKSYQTLKQACCIE